MKKLIEYLKQLFTKKESGHTTPPKLTSEEKPFTAINAPSPVEFKAAWDYLPQGEFYSHLTAEALRTYGADLLTLKDVADADIYSPGFSRHTKDERIRFFVAFISCMAWRESNFKNDVAYEEDFDDSKGQAVISRGLLQLSLESVNQKAYGGNVKSAKDLHDPKTNIECGVKILNHWIPKDGFIATQKFGGARYWSVLRDHSASKIKIIQKLKELGVYK